MSSWRFSPNRVENLTDALKGLEDVGSFDPVWDVLNARIPALQQLARRKLEERRTQNTARYLAYNKLIRAFDPFVQKYKEPIGFHEMHDLESIDRHLANQENVDLALSLLGEIGDLFDEYQTLGQKHPENRSDRRQKDSRMSGIEDRLSQIYSEFLGLFEMEPRPTEGRAESVLTEPDAKNAAPTIGEIPGPKPDEILEPQQGDDVEGIFEDSAEEPAEEPTEEPAEEPAEEPTEEPPEEPAEEPTEEPAEEPTEQPTEPPVEESLEEPPGEPAIEDGVHEESATSSNLLEREHKVWECYAQGQLPEAYWLSYGINNEAGASPRIINDVLFACALQPWVGSLSDGDGTFDTVVELGKAYQRHPSPLEDLENCGMSKQEAAMLVAGASVSAALFEQVTGAQSWLQQAARADIPLAGTVGMLSEFAATYAWMNLKRLTGRSDSSATGERLKEVRRAAEKWLAQARTSRLDFHPATLALRYLASENGPLGSVMEAISHGADPAVIDDRIGLVPSSDAKYGEMLAEALRRVGKSGVTIDGRPRSSIYRRISEASAICHAYRDASQTVSNHEVEDANRTRLRLFALNLAASMAGERAIPFSGSKRAQALASGLSAAVERTATTLEGGYIPPSHPWPVEFQSPLLRLEEIPITPEDPLPERLTAEQASMLADALDGCFSWRLAALLKAECNDFFGAFRVLEYMERTQPSESVEVRARIEEMLQNARRQLADRLTSFRSAIEEATIDSTLSERDKSDFDAVVLSIEENSKDLRINRLLAEVDEWHQDLTRRRSVRAKALGEHLEDLNAQIRESREDAITAAAERYAKRAAEALEGDDTALADEFIGRAEDVLRTGVVQTEEGQERREDWAKLFLSVWEPLSEGLGRDARERKQTVRKALLGRQSVAGIVTGGLLSVRLAEVKSALDALDYIRMRPRTKARDRKNLHHDVTVLMAYLGFLDVGAIQSVKGGEDYQYFKVKIGLDQNSPLPQFGSALNGTCDVVVVWERPDPETLAGILKQLGVRNPLVLYVGQLTRKWRSDWANLCRENMLTALVVDDVLIHFLAGQYTNRLHACVSCAMLWGYANPYSFSGPIVPQEMFKGRERVIQQIEHPLGSAVIYGGRQLGKSAALREFARRSHRPGFNQYVVYKDIKQVGKPGAEKSPWSVWKHIARGLSEVGLPVSPRAEADEIASAVSAQMAEKPDLRIWVLLDEADDFLKADGSGVAPFTVVQQMKTLMDSTERRFKVVFSGLHSVQKYSTIPNHPFAHFEAPMVMGPLEPRDAIRLIKEPLSALGFRFDDDNPVYRILAYTNSHPALVQLFCSEIVKMAANNPRPYTITLETVEMVFRNQEIRGRMRERFEWTLDLDDRYAVLAYAIIDAQRSIQDGYRQEFSVEESLHEARRAWPAAFLTIKEEECRALLDELIGLGILVKTDRGYRLRNANIVTALGSKSEIEERLRVHGRKDPPSFEVALDRRQMFRNTEGWHALTLAQEATLKKNKISFVFGSSALGMDYAKECLTDLFAEETDRDRQEVYITTPNSATLVSLQTWLRGRLASRGPWTVAMIPASQLMRFPESLPDTVSGIHRVLLERSPKRPVVVVVTFQPQEILQWYLLPQADRDKILGVVGQPVVARKWEPHALEMMLRDEGFLGGTSTVNSVRGSTGGWPCLLHTLYASPKRRPDHYDPKPDAKALRAELAHDAKKAREFLVSTGMSSVAYAEDVAGFVAEMESIQPCDIELMESSAVPPRFRQATLNTLVDLGIVERKAAKRSRPAKDRAGVGDGLGGLVVDDLVKELMGKR